MTSVYGYGHHDGFHQQSTSLGLNYYSAAPVDNNYRQHQYSNSFSGYPQQQPAVYSAAQVYNQVPPQAYAPVSYNTGYYPAPAPAPAPVAAQPPVSGGLSSVLDYDVKTMSKFLTYLSFRICGRQDTANEQFVQSVQGILNAVRLPLSTLILANYFLLKNFEKHGSGDCFVNLTVSSIKEMVVMCLVLANKANDDNNFTNKSWMDATGLDIVRINKLEVQWLNLFQWRLHDVKMDTYEELASQFEKYSKNTTAHEEKKQWEQQLQSQYSNYYAAEPVSPIRHNSPDNNSVCVSPSEHYASRFGSSYHNGYNWQSQNLYDYGQQNDYVKSSRYSHFRSYSEPDCCASTGALQRSRYCFCHYCAAGSKPVDWSYNTTAAY